ncbi:MAG: beta-ketoacyl-ACP synthase III [Desulfobacterales bacterium]|jgi:3-oxoacyl-[acyl-carrier-protein] synthase-3
MDSICLLGTGSYLPSTILTNYDLEESGLDTTHEWIVKRTGVSQRRIAQADETVSDLGYQASLKALEMAGLGAEEMDLIIMATITPDTCCPSAANWLQAKLDATRAVTFDVTAACSGFIFGLNVAEQYLRNKTCKNVLVVASEVMSRTLNWKDRSTCILWGDGAGAAVVTREANTHQILSTHIHTDGANGQDLLLPGGGSKTTPISHDSVDKGLHYLKMIEANLSFRVAVRRFIESIKEPIEFNHLGLEDINWIIPHQANVRMFQNIAKSLKIPFERFYLTLQKYGNISSASCAISLDEAVRDGSIQPGDLVCLPVFGGGLTWGSALIRW